MDTTIQTDELLRKASRLGVEASKQTGVEFNPVVPPSSATEIKPIASFNLPDIRPTVPDISGISGLTAFYGKQFELAQKQQEDYQKQSLEQQKIQSEQTKPFLERVLGGKSPSEARGEARSETGVSPADYFVQQRAGLAEIEKLNEEYNAIVEAKENKKAKFTGPGVTEGFVERADTAIEKEYAPKLNRLAANIKVKAAIFAAKQDNFKEAQTYVDQAVQDATADLKFNYDMFQTFYDINQDRIDKLDTKYSSAIKSGIEAAEKAYTVAYKEAEKKGELLIEGAKAGVDLSSYFSRPLLEMQTALAADISAGGGTSFSPTQTNTGAQNAGLPIGTFRTLNRDVQNFFVSAPQSQINNINALIQNVKDGEQTSEEATEVIDSSVLAPTVKNYLKELVSLSSPVETSGFWNNFWGNIKGVFQ